MENKIAIFALIDSSLEERRAGLLALLELSEMPGNVNYSPEKAARCRAALAKLEGGTNDE